MPAPQNFTMDYDTNYGSNTIVSGKFSRLVDRSAGNYAVAQSTDANRPAVVDVSGKNVAAFTFSGTIMSLVQETGHWLNVVDDAGFTVAARVRMTDIPFLDETQPASGVPGIIATSFGIFVLGARTNTGAGGINQFVAGMYNHNYTSFTVGSASMALNTWYDVAARFYGTTLSVTVDGTETTSVVSGTLPYFAWEEAPVVIGNNPSGGAYFEGDVRFARIYNYSLSDTELSDLSDEWDAVDNPPVTPFFPSSLLAKGFG
jgi:hypothetical protein